jgi:hypothetical protein
MYRDRYRRTIVIVRDYFYLSTNKIHLKKIWIFYPHGIRYGQSKESFMPKFLSDEWFLKVDELTKAAADLEIPKAMKDVVVNLMISGAGGDVPMSMDGGIIRKGHAAGADVEMSMPAEYALSIIVRGDWSAGMKGWVARKIKVSGNMRKLIPLQVYKATASQEDLRRRIESITET